MTARLSKICCQWIFLLRSTQMIIGTDSSGSSTLIESNLPRNLRPCLNGDLSEEDPCVPTIIRKVRTVDGLIVVETWVFHGRNNVPFQPLGRRVPQQQDTASIMMKVQIWER